MLATLFGMTIGIVSMLVDAKIKEYKPKQPEIKPCRCLTYYEMQYYSTKYDMYIDSINHGSKKNRQRYADSTVKFGKILRQTQK